jgi:hypothetical protein
LYDVALAIARAIVIGKISVLFIFLIHMVLRVTLSESGDYALTIDAADLEQITSQITGIFDLKSLNVPAANLAGDALPQSISQPLNDFQYRYTLTVDISNLQQIPPQVTAILNLQSNSSTAPVLPKPVPLVLPRLPTQAQIDARFKYLNNTIKQLLKSELGQYELVKASKVIKTLPAVWTEPPVLPTEYKMKEKSGIEVIISRESDLSQQSAFNNVLELYEKYTLTLRQYDTAKTTQLAVTKLLNSNLFVIIDQPRTIPYTQLSSGLVYETTTVKITSASWYLRG